MAHKINKAKRNYTYGGNPKSYWDFAKTKAAYYIPSSQKESDFDKQKRLERNEKLKKLERLLVHKKKKCR